MQPEKIDLNDFMSSIISEKDISELSIREKIQEIHKKEKDIDIEEDTLKISLDEEYKKLLENNAKIGNEKEMLLEQMKSKVFENYLIKYGVIFKKIIQEVNQKIEKEDLVTKKFFSSNFLSVNLFFLVVLSAICFTVSFWLLFCLFPYFMFLLMRHEFIVDVLKREMRTEALNVEMEGNEFLKFPVDKININVFLLKTLATSDLKKKLVKKLIEKGIQYPEGEDQENKLLSMLYSYESFYLEEEIRNLTKDSNENILKDVLRSNLS